MFLNTKPFDFSPVWSLIITSIHFGKIRPLNYGKFLITDRTKLFLQWGGGMVQSKLNKVVE